MRRRAGRLTTVLLGGAVVASIVSVAFAVRWSSWGAYREGLLVEAPSFFLGGVLLVLLLEWLSENRTRERWAGYLGLTKRRLLRAVEEFGENLTTTIELEISGQMSVTDLNPRLHGSSEGLNALARRVEEAPEAWKDRLNEHEDHGAPPAKRLAGTIDHHLNPLNEHLRVVQIPSDGVLLGEALLRLLDSNETLQESARWISVGGSSGSETAEALIAVFRSAAALSAILTELEEPPSLWHRAADWFNRRVCEVCRHKPRP